MKNVKNNNVEICNCAYEGEGVMAKRTTISLSDAELTQLKELAKEEHRPMSRQIVYMMHFYLKLQKEK
jgi:hypothetical protein